MTVQILVGDCREVLRRLPDDYFQTVSTSPPFWGLRDYGIQPVVWEHPDTVAYRREIGDWESVLCEHVWGEWKETHDTREETQCGKSRTTDRYYGNESRRFNGNHQKHTAGSFCRECGAWLGSLGLEPTPDLYVAHLVDIFRDVRRVLRPDGTVWLNLGDCYAGSWGNYGAREGKQRSRIAERWHRPAYEDEREGWNGLPPTAQVPGLKPKDLVGIPWRVAFALQADGWWLRSDIIWAKPNGMPESVRDRPTSAHEYIFLLGKSQRYFYDQDAVREPLAQASIDRISQTGFDNQTGGPKDPRNGGEGSRNRSARQGLENLRDAHMRGQGRNKRDVWTIPTHPFPESHFATFPPTLVEICLKAGTSAHGCCPECGAAWERMTEKDFIPQEDVSLERGIRGVSGQKPMDASNQWDGIPRGLNHVITLGFRPTCACGAPEDLEPDDLKLILTPTGERAGDDPSMTTGRAGYNRPRGDNEGQRPITRYEQRRYAEQLKNSPYRAEMAREAGLAFEHYIRTDKSGARPIPPDLLEAWTERGWLERETVPEWHPPRPVPCRVLDPFGGAGTTGLVADRLNLDATLIEIKEEYAEMARARIAEDAGPMFSEIATLPVEALEEMLAEDGVEQLELFGG